MQKLSQISFLYYIAMIYDGVLGLAFLFAAPWVFEIYGVVPPNHFGYAQFPGALLLIFAVMFLAVARDPIRSRNLIPYGMLLKVAYCGVVFFHWFSSGIPGMWKPFAFIDLVFLILFAWSFVTLRTLDFSLGRSAAASDRR